MAQRKNIIYVIETCLFLVLNPETLFSQEFKVLNKVLNDISAINPVEDRSEPVHNQCSGWTGP